MGPCDYFFAYNILLFSLHYSYVKQLFLFLLLIYRFVMAFMTAWMVMMNFAIMHLVSLTVKLQRFKTIANYTAVHIMSILIKTMWMI